MSSEDEASEDESTLNQELLGYIGAKSGVQLIKSTSSTINQNVNKTIEDILL